MRHSVISDILDGPCPEPELIRPRLSMAGRSTLAVTRCQDVGGSGTQSETAETPPADTSAPAQPRAGATPPVDREHLPPSSSSVYGADTQTAPTPSTSTRKTVSTLVLGATDDDISTLEDIQN